MKIEGFKNIALQFSGGKDSLACLYLLREHLDQITVYWLNTGDGCPETLELIEQIKPMIPKFVEIKTDVKTWRKTNGIPSDLVSATSHKIAEAYGQGSIRMSNRLDCCYANLMAPMHQKMIEDGVDCVIRGTKLCDTGKVPAEGNCGDYYVMLPIKDWSHQDVFNYLALVGAPYNKIYNHYKSISAPECFGCTAWWDDGKSAYFKALHPEHSTEYRASLLQIKAALQTHLADLETELENI